MHSNRRDFIKGLSAASALVATQSVAKAIQYYS